MEEEELPLRIDLSGVFFVSRYTVRLVAVVPPLLCVTIDENLHVPPVCLVLSCLYIFQVEGQEVMTSWQASIYRMMARDGMMQ